MFQRSPRLALFAAAALAGAALALPVLGADHRPAAERASRADLERAQGAAQALSLAFREATALIRPSVVTVTSAQRVRGNSFGLPGRPELQRFFGVPLRPAPEVLRGQGTGVVLDGSGVILTNDHVVKGAEEVTVKCSDGRQLPASVVGVDEKTDLAVLRVQAGDLTPARLGDSDALAVGDWVIAVGNPFGLEQTVTAGIVSAKGRNGVGIAEYEDFIQTDAAINPGNSGGPLVDLTGAVVGINTAIASDGGGNLGVGFSIPIRLARKIADQILDHGSVQRGWLGVAIQDLTPELARSFGLAEARGALVGDVTVGGPAAAAGVRPGDIIRELNGAAVENSGQLRNAVAALVPGSTAALSVLRAGAAEVLTAVLGAQAADLRGGVGGAAAGGLGMSVDNVTPEAARELSFAGGGGALVTDVAPGSAAELSGLRVHDIVVAVGDQPVADAASLATALARADLEAGVRLTVASGGVHRFVLLQRR